MKNKIKKIFPFVLLFVTILFLHFIVKYSKDDIFFQKALDNTSIISFLKLRWKTWTSRMILEFLEVIFAKNIYIWRIVDTIVYISIAINFSRIFNVKKEKKYDYLICGSLLLYSFFDFANAGYESTSINFNFTFAAALFAIMPLIKFYKNQKNKWYDYLIGIPMLLIAINQEQLCVTMTTFLISTIIYSLIKKNRISKYNILLLILCIISLIIIFLNPGNAARAQKYLGGFIRYKEYNFFEKTYIGYTTLMAYLINNKIILFIINLSIYLNIKEGNYKDYIKMMALVTFIFVSLITIGQPIISSLAPKSKYIFLDFGRTDYKYTRFTIRHLIPFIIGMCITLSNVFTLVKIDMKNKTFNYYIYLLGMLSRFVIGFTVSVFFSHDRTMFFNIMMWSIIIANLANNLKEKKSKEIFNSIFIVTIFINIINFIYSVLIPY